ncbi:DUF2569 family protein [Oleomonas cavernae]|uniref:DUF2569 family protein n=1 Tax=Oleomonas cavernae TaxID=2320859 RepID=A0A418WTL9_9PROT|nr:DUF2569 family protein [Oleomonas cavernae]RJF94600.1 DUF2569 family protein [Oleomonas cavernae]
MLLVVVALGVALQGIVLANDNPALFIGVMPLQQDVMQAWQIERFAKLILFLVGLRCLYLVLRRDRRLPELFSIWLCLWLAVIIVDGLALKLIFDIPLDNRWIWQVIVGAVICVAGVSYANSSTSVRSTFVK